MAHSAAAQQVVELEGELVDRPDAAGTGCCPGDDRAGLVEELADRAAEFLGLRRRHERVPWPVEGAEAFHGLVRAAVPRRDDEEVVAALGLVRRDSLRPGIDVQHRLVREVHLLAVERRRRELVARRPGPRLSYPSGKLVPGGQGGRVFWSCWLRLRTGLLTGWITMR
jgi:hypothetical protein